MRAEPFVTRFAPSPNGYLHLGHAFSALTAFHAAKAASGAFLLRIDDIDTSRARQEFTEAIMTDLQWLGLDWPQRVRFQSAHLRDYGKAAQHLARLGVTYPCFCTRKTLMLDERGHYAGPCKALSSAAVTAKQAQGQIPAIRLDSQKALSHIPAARLAYEDTTSAETVGTQPLDDPIIVRKDIGSSYLLSCAVDDAAQGITHVIRGQDIQALTPLQVLLQALLGLPTPIYQHHGLITDDDQRKLSKSEGSPSLKDARLSGVLAKTIRNQFGF